MDEVYARLNEIFNAVFDDDTIAVTPELTAEDVPGWDSLNHIRLVLAIQKAFKIKFTVAQTAHMANVGELADLIRAKSGAA